MGTVHYECVATSVEGFIQQVAIGFVRNHYRFYVMGYVREGKDPSEIDYRIVSKYGIAIDKWERHRRKRAGVASLQYIRHDRTFLIVATGPVGCHAFFREESEIRDAREVPIRYSGYEISYRGGRVWVRIERQTYKKLWTYFRDIATKRRADDLAREFRALPFEPYRPVRYQLFRLLEEVNAVRGRAGGLASVPETAIRAKRRTVKPFQVSVGERGPSEVPLPSSARA